MRVLKVSVQEEGQRLDRMLAKYMQLAPRSFFYKMLRKKNIKLNGKKADGSEKVAEGDEITLYLADDTIDGFRKQSTAREENAKQPEKPQMKISCGVAGGLSGTDIRTNLPSRHLQPS